MSKYGPTKISTHALREEGDVHVRIANARRRGISTHALREEGDAGARHSSSSSRGFLPTPSARRATAAVKGALRADGISTHALREEGDLTVLL